MKACFPARLVLCAACIGMAAILSRAADAVGAALREAAPNLWKPVVPPPQPMELTRDNFSAMKAQLPGTVLQFNDDSFGVVPFKSHVVLPSAASQPPQLYTSKDGTLVAAAGRQMVPDLGFVKRVAPWCAYR